jgi:hypothetical protein
LAVQNRAYVLADVVLRPGGRLNIVDRRELPRNRALIDDIIHGHREQASGTSLVVSDEIDYKTYQPPNGVQMVTTPGTSGRQPDLSVVAVVSTCADKAQ